MPTSFSAPQTVNDVVEMLLAAQTTGDLKSVAAALQSQVLRELDRQQKGLGNIHLAYAFAALLLRECPPHDRDRHGVPDLRRLVREGTDETLHARLEIAEEVGTPFGVADAKAEDARLLAAVPLAQEFVRLCRLQPAATAEFVRQEARRCAAMTDEMWAVLYEACSAVRGCRG
ncbi:hypothetical protein DR950_18145 [Kitasatospora xanthocidica]|uniref:Uncharacterized protein n=1 Tax=Kitasatospora xanthocidica TaxID=83382 RepID=A0A372ZU97_9ACTN|nr:hypothetical protein [Kitasatospora xanthocidica]RGD59459.1 hypothetical protein DR950_18145 [Kitasatospora xanthocidica]